MLGNKGVSREKNGLKDGTRRISEMACKASSTIFCTCKVTDNLLDEWVHRNGACWIYYKPFLNSFRPVRTMFRVKMRRENDVAMASSQRKMLPFLLFLYQWLRPLHVENVGSRPIPKVGLNKYLYGWPPGKTGFCRRVFGRNYADDAPISGQIGFILKIGNQSCILDNRLNINRRRSVVQYAY